MWIKVNISNIVWPVFSGGFCENVEPWREGKISRVSRGSVIKNSRFQCISIKIKKRAVLLVYTAYIAGKVTRIICNIDDLFLDKRLGKDLY